MTSPIRRGVLAMCAVAAVIFVVCASTTTVDAVPSTTTLSASTVDLGFWKRMFGQTELVKRDEGYHMGRTEELERRANGLGAVLAILIILALIVWAGTGYAWWRLRQLRGDQNVYKAAPVASPMLPMMPRMQALPSMASMVPQPSGPRLVSQKVIGLPGGSSPVRLA